jgi:hypothetical protein
MLTGEDTVNTLQHKSKPRDSEAEASWVPGLPNIGSRQNSPTTLLRQCPSCATEQRADAGHGSPSVRARQGPDSAVTDPTDLCENIDTYIRRIPAPASDYLLRCYYQSHNIVIPMIHPEVFAIDRARGTGDFYSPLLYLCMLAIGYRYADRLRPEMVGLDHLHLDSKLYQKLKAHIDRDISFQWTVSLMQAILLVADLEARWQRYAEGWIHCGNSGPSSEAKAHADP